MTKKEFIRRSLAAKESPSETMAAVMGLETFRDEFYFPPELNWPEEQFNDRCTAIWTVDECIRRIRRQYDKSPTAVVEEFLFELLRLMNDTDNLEKARLFRVASCVTEDILDYLNALRIS